MARHITNIVNPLKAYLKARFAKDWRVDKQLDLRRDSAFPPPLFVAQKRGEACLITGVFNALESKQVIDPQSQQHLWQQLIVSGYCLSDIIERSGASAYLQFDTQSDYQKQCYNAYCIILWDVTLHDKVLAQALTKGLVDHYLPTLFPTKAKQKTPEQFKKDIAKILTQQWGIKPNIKESFTTDIDSVTFSLLAKTKGYATMLLVTEVGRRLNNTRLKACERCLKNIEKQAIPMPLALTKKKNSKPAPLVHEKI